MKSQGILWLFYMGKHPSEAQKPRFSMNENLGFLLSYYTIIIMEAALVS